MVHSQWGAYGPEAVRQRPNFVRALISVEGGGGRTALMPLPEMGIPGYSHLMMADKNNLQIADVIQKWITENTTGQ